MAKVVASAHIPNEDERSLICEWLQQTDGCTYNVIGTTVVASYAKDDTPNNSDIYWGLVHMFEQYPDHSIDHHAGRG